MTTKLQRLGSLFSGKGGLDLAVEAITGARTLWHAETDPYAAHVLAARFPGVPNLGDVRQISTPPAVDLLAGGFPCQDISQAGKRAGIDGKRSGLWLEYARIIEATTPALVFIENVAELKIRGLDRVLGRLARLGFDAEWGTCEAADVGSPNGRRRLFILAWRERESLEALADPGNDGRQRLGPWDHHDWSHAPGRNVDRRGAELLFPPGPEDDQGWDRWIARGGPEPGILRGALGPPTGVDARRRRGRLRVLGNGVAPRQAAAAFLSLAARGREKAEGS